MSRELESGSESFAVSEQPSLNFSPGVQEWNSINDANTRSFTTAQDTVNKEFGNLILDKGASAGSGRLFDAVKQSFEVQNEQSGAAGERPRDSGPGTDPNEIINIGGTGAESGGGGGAGVGPDEIIRSGGSGAQSDASIRDRGAAEASAGTDGTVRSDGSSAESSAAGERGAESTAADGRGLEGSAGIPREISPEEAKKLREHLRNIREKLTGDSPGIPRERSSEEIMEDLREFLRSTRDKLQAPKGTGSDDGTATISSAESSGGIYNPDRPVQSGGLEGSSGPSDRPGVNSRPNNPPPDRAQDNDRPVPTRDREADHPDIPAGPQPSLPIEDGVPAPQPGRYVPADLPAAPMPGRDGDGTNPVPWPELPIEDRRPGRHPVDLPPVPMPGRDRAPSPKVPVPGWRRGIAGDGVVEFGS